MSAFELLVIGKPVGKGRPRFAGGRAFTDERTAQAERDIFGCWIAAGSPRLNGPIELSVVLKVERPKGHYRKDGSLSAEGRRHPHPAAQKPDVDNALKLVMDALNGRAWGDDVQVVWARVQRVWGSRAETVVWAAEAAPDTGEEA